jgi:hypothetical protein
MGFSPVKSTLTPFVVKANLFKNKENRTPVVNHTGEPLQKRPITWTHPALLLRLALLIIPLALVGCSEGKESTEASSPPLSCPTTPEALYDPFFEDPFFPVCPDSSGSGSFGLWQVDALGLPSFRYTSDHEQDPRASYFTSWGESRDHWHQLGNDAITVTAHNEGYLQFWDWTRGGKCINRYQPSLNNHSGGFRFLKSDEQIWNTLHESESHTTTERLFGIGYFEKETRHHGLVVRERTYAPYGRDPLIISETTVHNQSSLPQEFIVYEYWDFNLYELLTAPIMTAPLGEIFEAIRWAFNTQFEITSSYDREGAMLIVAPSLAPDVSAPATTAISVEDYYPRPSFLACLTGTPDFYFSDQDAFFGEGGLSEPSAILGEEPSSLLSPSTAPMDRACLVLGKRLRLDPGDTAFVAYAFGYAPETEMPALLKAYREDPEGNFVRTMQAWSKQRADFVASGPDAEWLRRELLWHGYYLPSGSFYEDYFEGPIVNQGSAYAYIQGMNGAHRDFALFSMPLVYLRPDLARSILSYTMRSQDGRTGEIPYAHQGHGFTSGFLVHEESTDLDLFFLLAMAEYLGATRDFRFLDTVLPYYPLSAGAEGPVREHIAMALEHLEERIGTGPHGLIRAGSGDWNDVLIAFSPNPILTMIQGESNLNTAMACYLFPRLTELFRESLPFLADRMAVLGKRFCGSLESEWTGEWMRRGYLGNGLYLGEDQLFLDAQPWALLADIWDEDQGAQLLGNISELLVDPSPAGALCLFPTNPPPFFVPGSDTNGGTWAAVDSWLVWAWSLRDPGKAWNFFLKTTLHHRAEAYPDIWYGIWSGPDSYNAFHADRPGETFNWSFTPMTDFPVMNMNRHSGPLLDVIRLCGIDPVGPSIRISPRLPFDGFSLRLPLIGLTYLADRHRGYYRPITERSFRFEVRLPEGLACDAFRILLNGIETDGSCRGGHVAFEGAGAPGKAIQWEILP